MIDNYVLGMLSATGITVVAGASLLWAIKKADKQLEQQILEEMQNDIQTLRNLRFRMVTNASANEDNQIYNELLVKYDDGMMKRIPIFDSYKKYFLSKKTIETYRVRSKNIFILLNNYEIDKKRKQESEYKKEEFKDDKEDTDWWK